MSGHSHWHSIKHKKMAEDQKRGKIFSKLSRAISIAAREKGPAVESNAKLKMAIEQAKSFNMPKANIERAIKKGTGELEGEKLENIIYEGYGPGNIAFIIEGITDNKNRTLTEIKQILNQKGGKLAEEGAVKWLFKQKGVIIINTENQNATKDELELIAIEAGAEDIKYQDRFLEIYTKPENLESVKKIFENKKIKIESLSLEWIPQEEIELNKETKEKCNQLFESLDENDAVQNIYSNLKP